MSPSISTELVAIPFQGDTLQAVQDMDGNVWVGIRRVCDALAIDSSNQRKKLKAAPWASVVEITSRGASGAERTVSVVNLQALPLWLATIYANKVAPALRPKLVAYQLEAAKALADYFLKPTAPPVPVAPAPPMFPPDGSSLVQFTAAMIVQMQTLHQVVVAQEAALRQIAEVHSDVELVAEWTLVNEAKANAALAKADSALATANTDPNFMTVMGFCNNHGIKLCTSDLSRAGKVISAYCRREGIPIRNKHSETFGAVNVYRMDALEAWLRSRG